MKKIEENIFYRVYNAYLNKDYPAVFVSSLYLIFIYIFLLAPFYGVFVDLLKGMDKVLVKFLYAFYIITISILVFSKYYNNKKLDKILLENKNIKPLLPTWCYFLALPLSMILGIGFYIFISINILKRFNLEGYFYHFF